MAMVQIEVSGIKQTLIHTLVSSLDALISASGPQFPLSEHRKMPPRDCWEGKTGLFLILCMAHVRHSVNSSCETVYKGFP